MTPGGCTVHYHNLKWLMDHALRHGARRVTAARVRWNTAGNCIRPVSRELHADPPSFDGTDRRIIMRDASSMWYNHDDGRDVARGIIIAPGKRHSLLLELEVPCRKCDNCRARRARMWAIRAMQEFRAGSDVGLRTWFGTLTLNPSKLHIARSRARALVASNESLTRDGEIKRDDWDELPEHAAMGKLNAEISPDITRYLKRVRKGALPKWAVPLPRYEGFAPHETKFRFVCVAELGDRFGRLHYHLLVHEQKHGAEVRHAVLETQWAECGFSNWKVVRTPYGAAHYVSKYITKRTVARVRASASYGNPVMYEGRPNDITQVCSHDAYLSIPAIDRHEGVDGQEAP